MNLSPCLQRKPSGPSKVNVIKGLSFLHPYYGQLAEGTEILERIFNVMFYDRRVMMSKGCVLLQGSSEVYIFRRRN